MSRPRRSGGLRRVAGLAVAALVIWAVIQGHAGSRPAYCGSACYGHHATHSPAPHPLRKLLHHVTRSRK